MGNVRTEQIKRTAKELLRRFPEKFTHDFDNNKHVVGAHLQGTTVKIRNQIAGYITRTLAGVEEETATEPEVSPEEGAEA